MFDKLNQQFFSGALQALEQLYIFTYYHALWVSLITGLLIPMIWFNQPEKGQRNTLSRRLFLTALCLGVLFGPLAIWTVPWSIHYVQTLAGIPTQTLHYDSKQWWLIPAFVLAIVAHFLLRRHSSTKWNELRLKFTKRTQAAREERTDVRQVKDLLPDTVEYDPEDYINLKKGVFIGLDVNHKPQYIPLKELQKQHADILGTTGAGKGVASGLILYQLIQADEGVFVLDPKNDEWAPHLLKYACEQAGKPFYLIDLNKDCPQINLLADATVDDIEELLVAGFSFAEKGDVADFYRIDDRKAARKAPREATEEERQSLFGLFHSNYVQGLQDTIKAFYGKMEEMSLVSSVNATQGLDLKQIFDDGGCCYIIGAMRNAKILMAQKMILIRLFQLAEKRDRVETPPRPIAIFLDELQFHISKPAIQGLGTARDKGVHLFLAHQSIEDLRSCPADLNGDAVVGAVVENTKFKLIYKLQDPETAEWVAKMSGTILVDDETRYVESNAALSEIVDDKRNIRLAERYFVDTNMLLNLPPFVSYIFTATDVPKPSLISPIKVQKQKLVTFASKEPVPQPPNQNDLDSSTSSSSGDTATVNTPPEPDSVSESTPIADTTPSQAVTKGTPFSASKPAASRASEFDADKAYQQHKEHLDAHSS